MLSKVESALDNCNLSDVHRDAASICPSLPTRDTDLSPSSGQYHWSISDELRPQNQRHFSAAPANQNHSTRAEGTPQACDGKASAGHEAPDRCPQKATLLVCIVIASSSSTITSSVRRLQRPRGLLPLPESSGCIGILMVCMSRSSATPGPCWEESSGSDSKRVRGSSLNGTRFPLVVSWYRSNRG